MESKSKYFSQDAPAYRNSGGGDIYRLVRSSYPGESVQPMRSPPDMRSTEINAHATPQTTIIRPTVIISPPMDSESCRVTCHECRHEIMTRIDYKATMRTHLMALLLCVVGCWPCACVPYCMDSCLNIEHFCPNCNAFIGAYQN